MTAELDVGCCCCVAQGASKRFPGSTAGAPGARDSIHPVPHPKSVCVMYGPLDDGGIPDECHSFLGAFPEVLQCNYVDIYGGYGPHNEAVTDGPGLRVGGVFWLVC